MQQLLNFGFLDGERTLFDYGCGRGDDLRLLQTMGIQANGWDPVFRPREKRRAADIVNLGFVLNVIEDANERRETLQSAFSLARRALVVSVMLGYQSKRAQFAAFQDGVRTQRTPSRSTTHRTSSGPTSSRRSKRTHCRLPPASV